MRPALRVMCGVVVSASMAMTAACGDWRPPSPSGPSPWSDSPSAGARVSGTVQGVGNALTKAAATMTVTVEGTDLTVVVDGNGRFVLDPVPAGTINLRFAAPGVDATLTIENLSTADTVNLVVSVEGNTVAVLFEEVLSLDGKVELEGLISEINPEGTTRTWTVRGKRVSVPSTAEIRAGSMPLTFDSIPAGQRVHVRGAMVNNVVIASVVIVQGWDESDDDDDEDDQKGQNVNVKGTASELVPGCPNVQFKVGGWTIDTNSSTDWKKGACSGVADGSYLHVKGRVQPSGRMLAEWVMFQ